MLIFILIIVGIIYVNIFQYNNAIFSEFALN
jgi:archaellum component FlaF (FlaF/FlaG flagellin family)